MMKWSLCQKLFIAAGIKVLLKITECTSNIPNTKKIIHVSPHDAVFALASLHKLDANVVWCLVSEWKKGQQQQARRH